MNNYSIAAVKARNQPSLKNASLKTILKDEKVKFSELESKRAKKRLQPEIDDINKTLSRLNEILDKYLN